MEHSRKSGKRVEAFVSWKDRRPVEGRQAGGNARASTGAAKGMKKTNPISVNAVSVPMNRTPGTSEGPSTARSSMKSRDITKKQSRQLGSMEGTEERGEAISAGRVEGKFCITTAGYMRSANVDSSYEICSTNFFFIFYAVAKWSSQMLGCCSYSQLAFAY